MDWNDNIRLRGVAAAEKKQTAMKKPATGRRAAGVFVCCIMLAAAILAGCSASGSPEAGSGAGAGETGSGTDIPEGSAMPEEAVTPDETAEPEETVMPEEVVIPDEAKKLLEAGVSYYGSPDGCRMTGQQAEAFAEVIRSELAAMDQKHARMENMDPEVMDGLTAVCGAALIDTGGGRPVLFVAGGSVRADTLESGTQDWERVSSWSVWQYVNGAPELYQRGQEDMFGCVFVQYPAFYQDYLILTEFRSADDCDRNLYRYGDGFIEKEAASSTYLRGYEQEDGMEYLYTVDGVQKDKDAYDAWGEQWEKGAVTDFFVEGNSQKGSFTGVASAEKMIATLAEYADIAGSGGQGGTS